MRVLYTIKQSFIRNKFTFLYGAVTVSSVMGFVPVVPQIVIYSVLVLYALYCCAKPHSTNLLLVCFLIYIPIELLVTHPNSVFKPWEHYFMFLFLMACVSPLFQGYKHRSMRLILMRILLYTCAFLGVGSFFAKFMGINYMPFSQLDWINRTGLFGGLTYHSMLLGPIAGIGALYMAYCAYTMKKKVFWICLIFCLFSILFAESRSALIASIAGIVVTLYKLSEKSGSFIKICLVAFLIIASTFQLWSGALNGVIEKNGGGTMVMDTSSRQSKWDARMAEFRSSPLFGVGFTSVNPQISREDFNEETGAIEPGSSWLSIFSMLGIGGAILLIPLFFNAYKKTWIRKGNFNSVIAGLLTLLFIHMLAEGYIFFGGSFLAFCLWLSVGLGYDCKYEKEMAL